MTAKTMNIYELDTPVVAVDLDIVERNLEAMGRYCRRHGIGLRPHAKTHKIPALAQKQLESGATGITVAKLGEAEVMLQAGIDDILIAYPIVGDPKIERLAALVERARITVSLDSIEAAQTVSKAVGEGSRLGVLVEIDVGFRRCGVQSGEEALRLAGAVSRLPGLEFQGIMFYPGSYVVRERQEEELSRVNRLLEAVMSSFEKAGVPVPVVSGGSTPTARFSHRFHGVSEIRPGTYIFNDRNTLLLGATSLDDCAASVIVTVVSAAVPGRAIVDGGSKTFSSDPCVKPGMGFGLVKEDPKAIVDVLNEEHGYLDVSRSGRSYKVGERLTIVPNHVCATMNLHDEVCLTRRGAVQETCRVAARGRVR
jgi:D-serine deaminase-like pyridoxal phosphate-dependent protein